MVSRCLFISFKVLTVMNVYITVEMAAIIAKIETIVLIYSITLSKDIESYPFLHDVLKVLELLKDSIFMFTAN